MLEIIAEESSGTLCLKWCVAALRANGAWTRDLSTKLNASEGEGIEAGTGTGAGFREVCIGIESSVSRVPSKLDLTPAIVPPPTPLECSYKPNPSDDDSGSGTELPPEDSDRARSEFSRNVLRDPFAAIEPCDAFDAEPDPGNVGKLADVRRSPSLLSGSGSSSSSAIHTQPARRRNPS